MAWILMCTIPNQENSSRNYFYSLFLSPSSPCFTIIYLFIPSFMLSHIFSLCRHVSLLLDQGFKGQDRCLFHPLSNDMTICKWEGILEAKSSLVLFIFFPFNFKTIFTSIICIMFLWWKGWSVQYIFPFLFLPL